MPSTWLINEPGESLSCANEVSRGALDIKIVPTSIAFLIAFGADVAAKDDKALIQELFKQEWKTLKFGFELDGGDYNSWGPYIVLQRIDVDHISLSAIDHKNHRGALPVALKVLNTKDAAVLARISHTPLG